MHTTQQKNTINAADYFKESFLWDLKSGFITAIVALPLAIAFAIASGVDPIMGMYTAVIAGILAAAFGGSRFSITGPTGAMAILILSIVQKFGKEGLLLTGLLSGIFLVIFSFVKLGRVIRFIPFPVISGFTAGIGVIIFLGQVPNFLGLTLASKQHIWESLLEIGRNISLTNRYSVGIALLTVLCLGVLPGIFERVRLLKNVPPSIVALVLSVVMFISFKMNIPAVGAIPTGLPTPSFFRIDFEMLQNVVPAAFTIALLGAIESLLCATVADGMTNTCHDSNKELLGQGIANVIVPFFGGIPATAAIARTAVNIREGARTRFAAIYHSLFLLAILAFLGGFAAYLPKAFLAGVLVVVAVRMINFDELKTICKLSRSDSIIYFVTLILTVFTDLVIAVQVGMVLAMLLFFIKIVSYSRISSMEEYDRTDALNRAVLRNPIMRDKIGIFTIHGPFFFGMVNLFEHGLKEHMHVQRKFVLIRMKHVSFMDTTGVERLKSFLKDRAKANGVVIISGLNEDVSKLFDSDKELSALVPKRLRFKSSKDALEFTEKVIREEINKESIKNSWIRRRKPNLSKVSH